jgi:prepilin-type N-terminal cleavage/methylation domain-containing protein
MIARSAAKRAAFTLVELLVVIGIFVILLLVAVPAFTSMMYSSEQSMAENALRIGLAAARDAAVRSGPGRDAAAVFIFESRRLTIMPCVRSGTVDDQAPGQPLGVTVKREVFTTVPNFESVKLPKGWVVRGYASPGMIEPLPNGQWYEQTYSGSAQQGNWVFPETDFYCQVPPPAGQPTGTLGDLRQTFMVRFEGGTGIVKSDPTPVLVLFPSESTSFRATVPWRDYRADEDPDGGHFLARVLAAPLTNPGGLNLQDRQQLVGEVATDMIFTKAVTQLALSSEKALAAALGVRVDGAGGTGCLYQNAAQPTLLTGVTPDAINAWVEDRYQNAQGRAVASDCRLYTVQRYLGTLQEVTGTKGAQGVSQ